MFTQGQFEGAYLILWISSQMTSLLPKNHGRGEETGGWKVLEGHHEPQRRVSGSLGFRREKNH